MSAQFSNPKNPKGKEILDEKYFVPMGSGSDSDNPAYVWTTQLTYCSGIGFIHRDQNGVVKNLDLFHSQSQHADPPDSSFLETIEKFIDKVPKEEMERIVILVNPGKYNTFADDGYDMRCIKEHINKICQDKGKSTIPLENFVTVNGSTTFYINKKGEYGTLAVEANYCEEVNKIPPGKSIPQAVNTAAAAGATAAALPGFKK